MVNIGADGALRQEPGCFDIEEELAFWLSDRDRLHGFGVHLADDVLVRLLRFAYDCYLLHGRYDFDRAVTGIQSRYQQKQDALRCDWSVAQAACNAVWFRMAAHPCNGRAAEMSGGAGGAVRARCRQPCRDAPACAAETIV